MVVSPWRTALQPPGTSLSSGFRSWLRHLSTSTPQGQGLSKHHAVTLWVRPPRLRALARSRGAAGHREVPTQPSRSGQPQDTLLQRQVTALRGRLAELRAATEKCVPTRWPKGARGHPGGGGRVYRAGQAGGQVP